ncbi:LOW QUALITY PROTEIN: uncharacterized protein C12orf56 homolog [Balaenoptera acutorostrata]|uniref:LOW QUALITY PROTEIN: uncharacterized protein C12orf56 homolog n=1 Tax=Balaenoptera acutorostrata TaxID=9767 RepID=A0ABM3UGR7_BALAC|nr:LOW QUALITY PROTEIN: uncharacterized protein C12orf56 homolog [Balaenoptera acutorostrata]
MALGKIAEPRGNSGDETPGNERPRTGDALSLGGRSLYPPPPSPPSLGEHRHGGPDPHPSPAWGLPLPGLVLPANFPAASHGPIRVPVPPRAPSHLPYHSIPPPRLHSRGPVSRAERRRKQGVGRAALVLVTVVLRHGRSANPGDRAGRGRAPLAAPRPLAPSIAWRRAGKLASWRAGLAPQEGKEREGQLTLPPPSPLSQREARSPRRRRADQSQQPHGECRLRPANPDREPTTPNTQSPGGGGGFVARVGFTAGGAEAGLRGGVRHPQPSALQRTPRMASPARKNSRLDAFLRRHLPPEVYDAIRAYEPCIVVPDTGKHTLKYVVLSDLLIYLTENPPQSIRRVVALRHIVAIDLETLRLSFFVEDTNSDLQLIVEPSSKYLSKTKLSVEDRDLKSCVKEENNGPAFWRGKKPKSLNESLFRYHQESSTPSKDSTLGPPSDLKKLSLHGQSACRPLPAPSRRSCQPTSATSKAASVPCCTANTKEPQGLSDHKDSLSEIPFKGNGNGNEFYLGNASLASPLQSNPNLEKKESELHLYITSTTSSIFLHLKSSWNNYVRKATLLQDPLYVSELSPATGSQKPYRSEEKIKHFSQLKSELFLKDNTLRKILCLSTELKVAAPKNFILKRLFWKTSDLFYFLVNKLHEYLPESRDKNALQNKSQSVDELVACIEIIQTLGLMFRETETEASHLNTLGAKKGTLFNLLVILISEPQIPKSCPVFDIQLVADSALVEMSFDAELQKLILEYTDAATALLYEILLDFQQGNLGLGSSKFAISWMMSFLQSRPPIITFVARIVKRVVKGLSASFQLLSPGQAVLLYQQFHILKSCLQYSKTLAECIRNDYREEFRYFIHMPALEKRLPLCFPITQPTTQLFHEVLKLVEQKQCVKC